MLAHCVTWSRIHVKAKVAQLSAAVSVNRLLANLSPSSSHRAQHQINTLPLTSVHNIPPSCNLSSSVTRRRDALSLRTSPLSLLQIEDDSVDVIAGWMWLFSRRCRRKFCDCEATSDIMKKEKKCAAAALKTFAVKYVARECRHLGVLYPVHNGLKTWSKQNAVFCRSTWNL